MFTYNNKSYTLTMKVMDKYDSLEKLIEAIENGEIKAKGGK